MMSCETRLVAVILVFLTTAGYAQSPENEEYTATVESLAKGLAKQVMFLDTFDSPERFTEKWVISQAKKEGVEGDLAKYDGDWVIDAPTKNSIDGDLGLVFKEKAKHRAVSSKLNKKFVFDAKPLVVQYEVLFQDNQECGGAYMKLLSDTGKGINLKQFHDKTPYTIMFGPDKCGNTHHLHFIFRHKNPKNGSYEEKHSKPPSVKIDEYFSDGKFHLYSLVVYPDNTFKVSVDHEVINKGSLLEDFTPPVNPQAEIDDPTDRKPADWDDREKIPDPTAKKPDDWDESAPRMIPDSSAVKPVNWRENEPTHIVDPTAEKPDDWDVQMDGEWEAPLVLNPACEDSEVAGCGPWSPPEIENPAYKGKYTPPLIENPNYKGKWAPRKIPNPDYFEDKHPFKMTDIGAIGFELWSISSNIMFDNILITDDESVADKWSEFTFDRKRVLLNQNAETMWMRVMRSINYKPGWWALYFVYCLIPIGGYVWFLLSRLKEDSPLDRFFAFTNTYPWLWALYTVILLIPVTTFVYCCFWTKQDNTGDASSTEPTDSYKGGDDDDSGSGDGPKSGEGSDTEDKAKRSASDDLEEGSPENFEDMKDGKSDDDEAEEETLRHRHAGGGSSDD